MTDDPRSTIGYPNERCTSLHPVTNDRCDLSRLHKRNHKHFWSTTHTLVWPQTDRAGNTITWKPRILGADMASGPDVSVLRAVGAAPELAAGYDTWRPTLRDLAHALLAAAPGLPMPRWLTRSGNAKALGTRLLELLDANAEGRPARGAQQGYLRCLSTECRCERGFCQLGLPDHRPPYCGG